MDLARNTENIEFRAFSLTHSRHGVLSLSLSENDDEDKIKLDLNVEFLITTGPSLCPKLDNKNIVFGTVLVEYQLDDFEAFMDSEQSFHDCLLGKGLRPISVLCIDMLPSKTHPSTISAAPVFIVSSFFVSYKGVISVCHCLVLRREDWEEMLKAVVCMEHPVHDVFLGNEMYLCWGQALTHIPSKLCSAQPQFLWGAGL